MSSLTASTVLNDPAFNAASALGRWPDDVKRKGDWRDSWFPWVDHGLRNGLHQSLPVRLMGHFEIFDAPDGHDSRSSRSPGRFLIGGGAGTPPVAYMAADLGKRKGLLGAAYVDGEDYDGVHADDRDRGGWGWIAVQFTEYGLAKLCVGFYFHKARDKGFAMQQAQVFLGALKGR